jgi:ATP-dependent Clp protease ATP-binding subunit ClpC
LLERTRDRLHQRDVTIEFTDQAVDWLARHGHQPEYGARPLRRTIQREVDNPLSRLLLDGHLPSGSRVVVETEDGRLAFRTTPPAPG